MELSDQQLVIRIAEGDKPSFGVLYDRYAACVFGLLSRMLGSNADAEELLQETFWQAWQQIRRFDETRGSVRVWLLTIARSKAVDRLRSRRVDLRVRLERTEDHSNSPVSFTGMSESERAARDALQQLPAEQCAAISLAFFGGLTHEEIAKVQEIPLGTAKTRIRLGMRRLRELLGDRQRLSA